jgi:hypothetical protein
MRRGTREFDLDRFDEPTLNSIETLMIQVITDA